MPILDNNKALRDVLEKLELLTGERAKGNRRAVLIGELNDIINNFDDQNASVKRLLRELEVQLGNASASFTEQILVRADETSALAQIIQTLRAQIGNNVAEIEDVRRALATTEMAMAEHVTTMTASVNSNSASIVEESRVRATADEAVAQQFTTLSATVVQNYNTLNAMITTEATARATGDQANANQITTLTATVNNQSAQIVTATSALAQLNGKMSAEWYVAVTLAGAPAGGIRLTGIKNLDGTITKDLYIDANTHINGNLIVDGTINVTSGGSPIANDAISGVGLGSGSGNATAYVEAKKAGDKFVIIASYAGGDTSLGGIIASGQSKVMSLKVFDTVFTTVPIFAFAISGIVVGSTPTLVLSFTTGPTTVVHHLVAGGPGIHSFNAAVESAVPVNIVALRVSK